MTDFKKLSNDRLQHSIFGAINRPTGSMTTGDITKGEVVTVTIVGGEGVAKILSRRTGAIMIACDVDDTDHAFNWTIDGGTLAVTQGDPLSDGTITFWVF
jgi:hypothetical protein